MRYIITALLASTTAAFADVPTVITDIPPIHALVAQVMGDLGTPTLLLAKGADEHDFALRPSQAGQVTDAGLVVWIGHELTPWLDGALENRPSGSAALGLLDAPGTLTQPFPEEAEHETEGDGHQHGTTDPHAWLNPDNAKLWLPMIATELSTLDPANAAIYAANAAAAVANIDTLDAEVAAILAPAQGKPIVMFHDAFGYYSAHYSLTIAGNISLGDASSPGAKRLSDLRNTLQTGEVLCIFPEVQHDPALVTQMAEGTGAKIGGALDPVGSSLEPGPGAYAALLKGLAQTIADCITG